MKAASFAAAKGQKVERVSLAVRALTAAVACPRYSDNVFIPDAPAERKHIYHLAGHAKCVCNTTRMSSALLAVSTNEQTHPSKRTYNDVFTLNV